MAAPLSCAARIHIFSPWMCQSWQFLSQLDHRRVAVLSGNKPHSSISIHIVGLDGMLVIHLSLGCICHKEMYPQLLSVLAFIWEFTLHYIRHSLVSYLVIVMQECTDHYYCFGQTQHACFSLWSNEFALTAVDHECMRDVKSVCSTHGWQESKKADYYYCLLGRIYQKIYHK